MLPFARWTNTNATSSQLWPTWTTFLFWYRRKSNVLFLIWTKCHYPRQGRENRATLHTATLCSKCSVSVWGCWPRKTPQQAYEVIKYAKKVKLLTLYEAWWETRIAFRCECPAVGLVTCWVHPSQRLQIHTSKKNKEQQNKSSYFWALTRLLNISIDFSIFRKCETVKFSDSFQW